MTKLPIMHLLLRLLMYNNRPSPLELNSRRLRFASPSFHVFFLILNCGCNPIAQYSGVILFLVVSFVTCDDDVMCM